MKEFVLDASFALRWCFEDEATEATESLLTVLQNQEALAWVPAIWQHELLNGLGKGITRGRVERRRAFSLGQEIRELPWRIVEIPIDQKLLRAGIDVQPRSVRRKLFEPGDGAPPGDCNRRREASTGG